MTDTPFVFISYSSKEMNTAGELFSLLSANGIKCWMAPQSIAGGSDYTKSIPEAIGNCRAFLLICSQNAQNSYWVKSEVIEAITKNKPIVPFFIEDFQLNPEFNFMLSPAHRILGYINPPAARQQLVNSLRSLLYTPQQPVQPPVYPTQPVNIPPQPPRPQPTAPVQPPRPQPTAPVQPPRIQQTAPIQSPEMVARVAKSGITAPPVLLLIFSYLAVVGYSILGTLMVEYNPDIKAIPVVTIFFATILFIVCAILMASLKKRTISLEWLNTSRMRLALIYFCYAVLLFPLNLPAILDRGSLLESEVVAYNGVNGVYLILLNVMFLVLMIIHNRRYYHGKPFLWMRDCRGMKAQHTAVPPVVCLGLFLMVQYIACFGISYCKEYSVAPVMSFFFNSLLYTAAAISLLVVRKHKSAPCEKINRFRYILMIEYVVFQLFLFIFSAFSLNLYDVHDLDSDILIALVICVAEIIAILVTAIAFRRTHYVYEYVNNPEQNNTPEQK